MSRSLVNSYWQFSSNAFIHLKITFSGNKSTLDIPGYPYEAFLEASQPFGSGVWNQENNTMKMVWYLTPGSRVVELEGNIDWDNRKITGTLTFGQTYAFTMDLINQPTP